MKSKAVHPHGHVIGFVNNKSYGHLYDRVNNSLKEGYGVVYAAEPADSQQNYEQVIKRMENHGSKNIRRYVEDELLTIADPESMYYLAGINPQKLVKMWRSFFSNAEKKSGKKLKGVLAVYSPDSYYKRDHYELFLAFEQMMGRDFGKPVQMLCWYKKKWLSQMPLAFAIRVLTSHKTTVHEGWKVRNWSRNRIIELIENGIDNELGQGSSGLLFSTMKARFELDKDAIVSQPEAFEEIMGKMLGNSREQVTASILDEIENSVAFDQPSDAIIRRSDQKGK